MSCRLVVSCLLSENNSEEKLHRIAITDEKLKDMAVTARNWPVYTRLNAALDSMANDIHYHSKKSKVHFGRQRSLVTRS